MLHHANIDNRVDNVGMRILSNRTIYGTLPPPASALNTPLPRHTYQGGVTFLSHPLKDVGSDLPQGEVHIYCIYVVYRALSVI